MHEDEIIEAYERELDEGDLAPRHRTNRGFWFVAGAMLLGCLLLMVEIFANRPLVGSIARAQADLRAAEAIARQIRSSTGSFSGADAAGLSAADGTRTYLGPEQAAGAPGQVSVFSSDTAWAASVKVRGACFYIFEQDGKATLYGGGTICTGRAALAANQDAW